MKSLLPISQPARGRRERRSGAVLMEAAIVLPIFILFLLGIIEFGRAMTVQQLVTNASRDGCRRASLKGSSNSSVEAAVDQYLVDVLGVTPSDVTVNFSVTPGPGSATNGIEVATAERGDKVEVEVIVPYDKVSFGVSAHLGGANLKGRTAMRHE